MNQLQQEWCKQTKKNLTKNDIKQNSLNKCPYITQSWKEKQVLMYTTNKLCGIHVHATNKKYPYMMRCHSINDNKLPRS